MGSRKQQFFSGQVHGCWLSDFSFASAALISAHDGTRQPPAASWPYSIRAQIRPEHFDRALADGKVSTNVYLRRIHNHALGMEWLLKSVIPRLQWPKPIFKDKRAIPAEEHAAIIQREQNIERRDFYELLWLTGAAQSDGACLLAEDINWDTNTICFTRKMLKSRGTSIKPTLFRFSVDIEAVLKRRPAVGQLFPYPCTVRAGDRATEFEQRCDGLAGADYISKCLGANAYELDKYSFVNTVTLSSSIIRLIASIDESGDRRCGRDT